MRYTILSACLFIFSALNLPGSVLAAIIWFVPLIVSCRRELLKFWHGFVWGVVVFTFHFSWLLMLLCKHHAGFQGLLVWVLTIVWFACASGLWFYSFRYSCFFSTVLFFIFLTRCSLLPCGRLEGYPLINPLLPFMSYVSLQQCIDENMIFVQPWWYGSKNPMFVGYRMVDGIAKTMKQYPCAHSIIMPESTFCFDLDEYEKFISIWADGLQDVTIVFGSHRKVGIGFLNSIFVLRAGKIIHIYDKQHLMPFVECIPYCFNIIGCGNLFLKTDEKVCARLLNDVVPLNGQDYQIFVCSELFFQIKKVKNLPIIFLWNDSWLQFCWTKKLALKFIVYFALKNSVTVIHASTQGHTNMKFVH